MSKERSEVSGENGATGESETLSDYSYPFASRTGDILLNKAAAPFELRRGDAGYFVGKFNFPTLEVLKLFSIENATVFVAGAVFLSNGSLGVYKIPVPLPAPAIRCSNLFQARLSRSGKPKSGHSAAILTLFSMIL